MNKSAISAVTAGVLWGFAGACGRLLGTGGLSSAEILLVRAIVASAVFGIVAVRQDPRQLKIRWWDWPLFLGSGVLGLFLFSFFYFRGIDLLPLSLVATFGATSPIYVLMISCVFLRERLTAKKTVALVLAVAGCVLTTGALWGAKPSSRGIMVGLAIGISYALFSIFSSRALKRGYTSNAVNFYSWFLTAACGKLFWPVRSVQWKTCWWDCFWRL